MPKIVLNDVSTTSNASVINENLNRIETALNELVLYRENPAGEPNEMEGTLDMNGKRIINLPAPAALGEPARLIDLMGVASGAGGPVSAQIVSFTPTPTIAAANVQAAIEELDSELRNKTASQV